RRTYLGGSRRRWIYRHTPLGRPFDGRPPYTASAAGLQRTAAKGSSQLSAGVVRPQGQQRLHSAARATVPICGGPTRTGGIRDLTLPDADAGCGGIRSGILDGRTPGESPTFRCRGTYFGRSDSTADHVSAATRRRDGGASEAIHPPSAACRSLAGSRRTVGVVPSVGRPDSFSVLRLT